MYNESEALSNIIIVEGPPGSGKGFLSGHYVRENPFTQHISAGNQVRSIRSGDIESIYSPTVLACLEAKRYLPDEVFGGIVLEGMTQSPTPIDLTLVDGFPYNLGDFDYVQERLSESGRSILGAVCLDATLETCVSRMSYRGMRKGEDARRNAIFSATESEREYYTERYISYQDTKRMLAEMFTSRGLPLEYVDTNPDILEEEGRQIVLNQFTRGINNLKGNNLRGV